MPGNDLVDLKQARLDSNWNRKGYLSKICSPGEQQLIRGSKDPSATLWLLWTMKEASYKVLNRLSGIRSYAPLSYECSQLNIQDSAATGIVKAGHQLLFTETDISQQYIHTAAVLDKGLFDQLHTCYLLDAPAYAAEFNRRQPDHVLWKNGEGLPLITCTRRSTTTAASVSHHGRYTAILYPGACCSDSLRSAD